MNSRIKRHSIVILCIIASLLGMSCNKENPARHLEALQSPTATERLSAAEALGDIGGETAINALIGALDDADPRVARRALLSLVEIGGAAVPQIASALQDRVNSAPILDYDSAPLAVINPEAPAGVELQTDALVLCFFPEVLENMSMTGELTPVSRAAGESGTHIVYAYGQGENSVLVTHPGVGAPLAVARLERMLALGVRRVVAVGGAGSLVPEVGLGDLVLLNGAIRDEGTSYHYQPASAIALPSKTLTDAVAAWLDAADIPYKRGLSWTTDAIYRETPARVEKRRNDGAIVVDMEASAFFAVAAFRGAEIAQIVYGADDLSGEEWDHRDWRSLRQRREELVRMAVDMLRTDTFGN